jgi:hypothetical protein
VLKQSGGRVVLTINGTTEWVVQDSGTLQELVALAERAEDLEITRRSLAEKQAGLVRPASEMLAEMQRVLDEMPAE